MILFKLLSLEERAAIVLEHGKYVDTLKSGNEYVLRFAMGKEFDYKFAEVHSALATKKISRILLVEKEKYGNDLKKLIFKNF